MQNLNQSCLNTALNMTCLNITYLNIVKWCVFTKASTRWCRGQVGGGWEETDSGNSSSHNSSQEMVANSRASEGSKSAGAESQSEASKESSGDLSERCVRVLAEDKAHFISSSTPFFFYRFVLDLLCVFFFLGWRRCSWGIAARSWRWSAGWPRDPKFFYPERKASALSKSKCS